MGSASSPQAFDIRVGLGPLVPEAFVIDAAFLIDAKSGEVVVRKVYCIIY